MRNKKRNKYLLLLILLLGITIGYAALSTTLKINGSATITKNNWSVYWNNVQVTPGSVDASTNIPSIGQDTNDPVNTKVTWSTTLDLPGDFYEFTVDAVNNGSIDAMITGITPSVTPALEDYIKYTVTYDDDVPIAINHLLPKKNGNTATVQKYKIRVEYDESSSTRDTINDMPSGGLSYTFSYEVTYSQANENAISKPTQAHFATDSWDDIIAAYKGGATKNLEEDMKNGVTRNVQIQSTQYPVRIANLSKPAECSQEGFSQTACGFVIEFTTSVRKHEMNIYDSSHVNGDGTKGGWKYSYMRAYIHSGVWERYDYSMPNDGIYVFLPDELKNKIIDTTVVSGYGVHDSENFVTTDKLYLLSPHELFEDVDGNPDTGISKNDKAYNDTRQLDYYKLKGITTAVGSNSVTAKKDIWNSSVSWFLRSVRYEYAEYFYSIDSAGTLDATYASTSIYVSPAFRIAE